MKNRNTFRVIKIYVFLTADFTNKLADSCLNYELQNTVALHNTAEQYPERVLVTNNLNSKIRKENFKLRFRNRENERMHRLN